LGAPTDPSPDAIIGLRERKKKHEKILANVLGQSHNVTLGEQKMSHWENKRQRRARLDRVSFSLTRCDSPCMVHGMRCPPSLRVQLVLRCSLLLTSLPFRAKLSNDQPSRITSRHHLYYSLLNCTYRILTQAAAAARLGFLLNN
jgi:hypothetical protein